LLALALLVAAIATFFLPPVYWRVAGRLKGEAFYNGRPTSYWAGAVDDFAQQRGWDDSWLAATLNGIGLNSWVANRNACPDLLERKEPAAVLVLIALLQNPDPDIRSWAAWGLGNIGPEARAAVPALVLLLTDEGLYQRSNVRPGLTARGLPEGVSQTAAWALGQIGPDARPAIPGLRKMLMSESDRQREEAAEAIKAIDPAAVIIIETPED